MHRLRLFDLTVKLQRGSSAPAFPRRWRSIVNQSSIVYGPDVAAARQNGLPIVALESTIITHGLPYPDNLNTALRVEEAIRKRDVVPATIAIINGTVHVGLDNQQLTALSKADFVNAIKCSRRDICSIVSRGLNGGTTVSATMLIAHMAGIPIMATGGIGGVHRGAGSTFDISTDLIELSRTPVAVVCSGVKSILDIGKTLEYLETQGVPVIKIGETLEFPAFYCSKTLDEIKAPLRVSNAKEAVDIMEAQRALGIDTGMLFAVSIPDEYALEPAIVDFAIREALKKADDMHISGKHVTPFLLSKLNEVTHSQFLEANIALIENNAKVAAEISLNLCERSRTSSTRPASVQSIISRQKPVVIGGAILDTVLQVKEPEINNDGRTHTGQSRCNYGGVARNIADALIKFGLEKTRLISVVGNDENGRAILKSLGAGAKTVEQLSDGNTARFTVVLDANGECRFCVSEIESFDAITPKLISERRLHLEEASFIVLDGNLPLDTMRYVLDVSSQANVPVWYEPTDIPKATRIFEAGPQWKAVLHFISPNQNELRAIGNFFDIPATENMCLATVRSVAERLTEYIPVVITTLGAQGVLVTRKASQNEPFYDRNGKLITSSATVSRLYPAMISGESSGILSVSGCGDCLTAAMIYGIHRNLDEIDCVSIALKAAAFSLKSFDAVPQTLATLSNSDKSHITE